MDHVAEADQPAIIRSRRKAGVAHKSTGEEIAPEPVLFTSVMGSSISGRGRPYRSSAQRSVTLLIQHTHTRVPTVSRCSIREFVNVNFLQQALTGCEKSYHRAPTTVVHARRRITSASRQDPRVDRTDLTKYSVVVTGWCGEVKCCVLFALRATEEVHWPGRLRPAS